jgi:glycosyltransferase involved in cell wall biosynthesis
MNKPLKIFIFIPTLQIGGAEKQVYYLAREVHRRGYRVVVGTFYQGGFFWDKLKNEGVKVVSFNRKGKFDFFNFNRYLERFIAENEFDIVQTFLSVANFFGLKAAAKAGLQNIFCGIRSSYVDFFQYSIGTGAYFYLSKMIINKYAKKIIYNSQLGNLYHKKLGFKKDGTVIWNGIDFEEAEKIRSLTDRNLIKDEFGFPRNCVVLSMVSRLDPIKDFATLLMAFQSLLVTRKDAYLLIAGSGSGGILKKIMSMAGALNVRHNVRFLGLIENAYRIISSSDVLICSSRGEGLSNSLIEAMSLGTPVVSTKVGDHNIVLGSGRGLLVNVGDAAGMRDSINIILNNHTLRTKMIDNSLVFAKENFSLKVMVDKYIQTWELS